MDGPVRNKAIQIVADEFLAKSASPQVSLPAQRRMKARKTVFIANDDDDFYDHSETGTDAGSTKADSSDDESFTPFSGRKPSFSAGAQPRFRSPSLPGNSLEDSYRINSSPLRDRSSSTSSKQMGRASSKNRETKRERTSVSFSDMLDSVINEVDSFLDNLNDHNDDQRTGRK